MQYSGSDNLCKAVRECRTNEILAQKRRQQLRANSHELLQLERHLQSALAYKQLNEQKQNAVLLKKCELQKKRDENAKFAADCEQIRLFILQEDEREKQKKKTMLEALKCQMHEVQEKRRKKLEEANKDREDIEKLMKQIEAEDILKRKDYKLLCERYEQEMEETFCNIRSKHRLEKERTADEIKRNLEYQNTCDKIKIQRELERKQMQKERADFGELLAQQIASINLEKDKREELLLSFSIEERRAKDDLDFKKDLMQKMSVRQKFLVDIENYRIDKVQKEKQFKEDEAKFREENMRYLEEQDKLWQLSEEKRRRKILEHKKLLTEMIEQRRYQNASKIAEQIADIEKIKNDDEKSRLLIEKERALMLSSVPRDLLSYLPSCALKPSDEIKKN